MGGDPNQGASLKMEMELDFMEAVKGVSKTVTLTRPVACQKCGGRGDDPSSGKKKCSKCGGHGRLRVQSFFGVVEQTCPVCRGAGEVAEKNCPDCHGEGRVRAREELKITIPPGVDDGARLRLRGKGEAGLKGGPSGDLIVYLRVKPHELFQREDLNVVGDVPVSFPQAALGCEVEVPTVQGSAMLKIPKGTQSGKLMRMKGKGIRDSRGNQGDHYARIIVETPSNLTKEQQELLEKLQATLEAKAQPQHFDFLSKVKKFLGK